MLIQRDMQAAHQAAVAASRSIGSLGQERGFRRGQIFAAPERGEGLALRVTAGCLRVCHPLLDGRRQITDFLFPGDVIGIAEVRAHNGTIEAVSQSRATLFDMDASDAGHASSQPDVYRSRLAAVQSRVFMLGHKNAREKLAAFLLEMSDRLSDGGSEVRLPMSRPDIADYLCLSPETVCRNFTQLVADGLIALPGAQAVRILHRAALEFIGR